MAFIQIKPLTEDEKEARAELKRLDALMNVQVAIIREAEKELEKLRVPFRALRSKCPHAAEDMGEGWPYDVCNLCGDMF